MKRREEEKTSINTEESTSSMSASSLITAGTGSTEPSSFPSLSPKPWQSSTSTATERKLEVSVSLESSFDESSYDYVLAESTNLIK